MPDSVGRRYVAGMETVVSDPGVGVTQIRVGIVEDDEGIRASLINMLGRSADCRSICSYPDAESALADLPRHEPHVVLMDINLPRMDGIECVRRLKESMPSVQFIMLTVYSDSDRLFRSLMAGASGYLLKRTNSSGLLSSIREVHAGGSPMTPEIARKVVQHFRATGEPATGIERLTPREKEILTQLSQGFLYKEIGENLGISMDTVRTYIRKIYEKLHVHSRAAAMIKFLHRQG
jgi:DNA-binding NarL/FixJ family response regulator